MKTYRQIKTELAASYGYSSWDMLLKGSLRVQQIEEEAVKIYATESIKEHLSRAAENAKCRTPHLTTVDRDSITNISIELP